ncbi:MAG: YchJ family protein [Myxococcota bacterium]|jgi:SEC-C motif-containing protein|nr:YchJ family protein [Myxococcota bacterium]
MTDCPCCSGKTYDECCGPIISGKSEAATPEALMRSRYSAYVQDEMGHLRASMHPDTQEEFDEKGAHKWATSAQWQKLEIVNTKDESGELGFVEFIAGYEQDGEPHRHHELAQFDKVGGRWYYTDGKVMGPATFVRPAPKVGRNELCPCGSGKKHKKCCLGKD